MRTRSQPRRQRPRVSRLGSAVLVGVLASLLAAPLANRAAAQISEVELERGPTSELYVKRRPAVPDSPVIAKELKVLLESKEKQANKKRLEAIGLLREFLESNPLGEIRAEGLFKLAELLWEESRRQFIVRIDRYERDLEACRVKKGGCEKQPKEPTLDLQEAEALYRELADNHPDFRRMDLVLYLIGFAARERGRADEAMGFFDAVIQRYPSSPLFGDAWMMVGEFYFSVAQWEQARDAYKNILDRPEAATYDLAMFKTAWCEWKLGNVDLAAELFKKVLDLAVEAERSGNASTQRRRAQLKDEALEYLVVVFTEDRSITAKEIYKFLSSIGGEKYSADVLVRVADAYYGQAEYERAIDTYRFLIELNPTAIEAAKNQRRIVQARLDSLDTELAVTEMKLLLSTYGPESEWAKANRDNKSSIKRSVAESEELVRTAAKNFHAEAQQREKATRKNKKPREHGEALAPAVLATYKDAAAAYDLYLSAFGESEKASEIHLLRGDILYFKLDAFEEAGDAYLAVGKSSPVGKNHKEALLKAMNAFEKARPAQVKTQGGSRELLPVDRKFAAAVDLYATLFPADPALVGVIFKNGQLFYDYGDYDEAIKRFGLIVTKYPDHEDAGPAGDRILKALAQGQDYENIEDWARKLKEAKAFQSDEEQARLDRLIVESIGKSGEKYGEKGEFQKAARFYLRIPKEFPSHSSAPRAMMNAGVMLEKGKRPEEAAAIYLSLSDKYPKNELADSAAFNAGQIYEGVAQFELAAEAYEGHYKNFPKSKKAADAVFNAGVLRQALGQHQRAIDHYNTYAKKFKERKDASEVAFRIGVVYEEAGDDGRADRAFRDFAKRYGRTSPRAMEAHVRSARTALRLGHIKRAATELDEALKIFKKAGKDTKAKLRSLAAEARYYQGDLIYRDFEQISLDVKPKLLGKVLEKKTKLLDKAQTIYLDVINYEDLKWATAALYRVGQIYDGFAESLRDAPAPKELSEADQASYKEELEIYVIEIEERAIELFSAGYEKAISMKVYNQYTQKIREALGRLNGAQYPPERESRPAVRYGDRPIEPALVKEVIRNE